MDTTDHTSANWQILRHVYGGWVELAGGRLKNVRLPVSHFEALTFAARTKPLGRRSRHDDSLRNAIGNWLYSREFGAWRNPNRARGYKGNNKELWAMFLEASTDYSLEKAVKEAT
jgi:hypothetical protein